MTTAEVEKLLRELIKDRHNPNSLTDAQWTDIKHKVWERIRDELARTNPRKSKINRR